jgi:hypothetical protein
LQNETPETLCSLYRQIITHVPKQRKNYNLTEKMEMVHMGKAYVIIAP